MSVDGGSNEITNGTSSLLLGRCVLLVEVLVTMTLVVRFVLCSLLRRGSARGVHSELLQLGRPANVNGKLRFVSVFALPCSAGINADLAIKRSDGTRVGLVLERAVSGGRVHGADGLVGTGGVEASVLDKADGLAEPVATFFE